MNVVRITRTNGKRKLQHDETESTGSTPSKHMNTERQEQDDATSSTDNATDNEELSPDGSDEEKFYRLLREEKNLYNKKALVKFPLKHQVATLIEIYSHPDKNPSCSLWHAVKNKWKVKDGKLVDYSDKPVCAFEDIYQSIYKIDLDGEFSKNITVLSNLVSEKYANITGVLVKFYCKQVSSDRVRFKRNRKNDHDSQIAERKHVILQKKKEEITLFEQKFSACTADSLLNTSCSSEHSVVQSPGMSDPHVSDLPAVEVPVHSNTSNTNVTQQSHGTSSIQEENLEHDSEQRSSTLSPVSVPVTDITKGFKHKEPHVMEQEKVQHDSDQQDSTLAPDPISTSDITKELNNKEQNVLELIAFTANEKKKKRSTTIFRPTTGLFNYSYNTKVCWLNSFCQCIFHLVPSYVIEAVIQVGDEGKAEYKNNPRDQFIANAYDVMRQMMQYKTLEDRQCFRGSALVTPSLFQMIDIIRAVIQCDGAENFTITKDTQYDLAETLERYDSLVLRLFDRLDITKSSLDTTDLSNFCFAKVQITFIDISTKMRVHPSYSFGKNKDEYVKQMGMFSLDLDNNLCFRRYKDAEKKKLNQLKKKRKLSGKLQKDFNVWKNEWTCALEPNEWVENTIAYTKLVDKKDYPDLEHNGSESQMKKFYEILTYPDVFIVNVPVGNFEDGRFLRYTVTKPNQRVKILKSPNQNDRVKYNDHCQYMIDSLIFRTNSDPNDTDPDAKSPGHYVSFVRDNRKQHSWVQWDDAIRIEYDSFEEVPQDIGVLVMMMFRKI